jgi:endonuclease-3
LSTPTPRSTSRHRRLLEGAYGPRPLKHWGKAVPVLVETILSQNTSNANSAAGYKILRRTFKTWDAVADARATDVERAIRISGLSNLKAPRIQAILRQIRERHGRIDLEFLRDYAPGDAMAYLRAFPVVGPKTANCVLLFSFGMPVFPVDTHIHRLAIRLGLIPGTATAEQAHDLLAPVISPEDRYPLHVLLIEHGRKICKPARPRCPQCVLLKHCPTGQARVATRPAPAQTVQTRQAHPPRRARVEGPQLRDSTARPAR